MIEKSQQRLPQERPVGKEWEMNPEPLSEEGTTLIAYEIANKEKGFAYKVLREKSWLLDVYKGESLGEKAALMKKVYNIYRHYLGEHIPITHFLVAKNKKGVPSIVMIQEKIGGRAMHIAHERDVNGKDSFTFWNTDVQPAEKKQIIAQMQDLVKLVDAVEKSPEFNNLPENIQEMLRYHNMLYGRQGENLKLDESGCLKIIDFL